jgi:hypothetical protein
MPAVGKAKSTEKEKLKPHPPNNRTPEHNLALCSLGKHEPTQDKPNHEISIQPSRILHFFHNTEKEAGHFDMTQVQADFTFPSHKLSFQSPSTGGQVKVLVRGDGKELEDKVHNNERMLVSLSLGSRVADDLVAEDRHEKCQGPGRRKLYLLPRSPGDVDTGNSPVHTTTSIST